MNNKRSIIFPIPYVKNQLSCKKRRWKIIEKLDFVILNYFINVDDFPLDLKIKDSIIKALNLNNDYWDFIKIRIQKLINSENLIISENEKLDDDLLKGSISVNKKIIDSFKEKNFLYFDNSEISKTIFSIKDLILDSDYQFFNEKEAILKNKNSDLTTQKIFYIEKHFNIIFEKFKTNPNKIKDSESINNENLKKMLKINKDIEEISFVKNLKQELLIKEKEIEILLKFHENSLEIKSDSKEFYEYFDFFKQNDAINDFKEIIQLQLKYNSDENILHFEKLNFNDDNDNFEPYFINDYDLKLLLQNNKFFNSIFNFSDNFLSFSFINDSIFQLGKAKPINFFIIDKESNQHNFVISDILGVKNINSNTEILQNIFNKNKEFYLSDNFIEKYKKISESKLGQQILEYIKNNFLKNKIWETEYKKVDAILTIILDKNKKEEIYSFLINENIELFLNFDILSKHVFNVFKFDSENKNILKNKAKNFNFLNNDNYSKICSIYNFKLNKENDFFDKWKMNSEFVTKHKEFEEKIQQMKTQRFNDIDKVQEFKEIRAYLEHVISPFEKNYCFDLTEFKNMIEKIDVLIIKEKKELENHIKILATDINRYIEEELQKYKKEEKDTIQDQIKNSDWDDTMKNISKKLKNWRNDVVHSKNNSKIKKNTFNEYKKYKEMFFNFKEQIKAFNNKRKNNK
ncbi:RNA polymerase beta'' subunit family protein [Mesomycoplasma neurolyticum]|uniref:Uncharacterized protein n=1 Tax=Mesomycoplasma neurolyticum TaxID=2120 RepID=A0A449A533_9BACT|nr:hypothetical protein [Mesomycoplasma neurolyticum]VEU59400.1 Uncharacterised protein [Mesomycoplasma neurolyticum]